jgi:hypothetical protein
MMKKITMNPFEKTEIGKPLQQPANAQRTREKAASLYRNEKWNNYAPGIYIAESRMPKSAEQVKILEKELDHARIMAAYGHSVYLLPERGPRKTKHPDAVVDGLIMEFKTITGNIRKIGENYKSAREKAENVFLKIDAPLSRRPVTRRLSGVIRAKGYPSGMIWVYFTNSGGMYYWTPIEVVS